MTAVVFSMPTYPHERIPQASLDAFTRCWLVIQLQRRGVKLLGRIGGLDGSALTAKLADWERRLETIRYMEKLSREQLAMAVEAEIEACLRSHRRYH